MNSTSFIHPVPQIRNRDSNSTRPVDSLSSTYRIHLLFTPSPAWSQLLQTTVAASCRVSPFLLWLPSDPLSKQQPGKNNFLKCPDPYRSPAENSDSLPLHLGSEPSPPDGSGVQPHQRPPASPAVPQSCCPRLPRLLPLPGEFLAELTPSPAEGSATPGGLPRGPLRAESSQHAVSAGTRPTVIRSHERTHLEAASPGRRKPRLRNVGLLSTVTHLEFITVPTAAAQKCL